MLETGRVQLNDPNETNDKTEIKLISSVVQPDSRKRCLGETAYIIIAIVVVPEAVVELGLAIG